MNFSKLEQLIDSMPERGIPACDLAVSRNGETLFRRSAGCSDERQTVPVSPNDLYWIFSATKVITCTAAMRLVEEGRLSLDDPVENYLPAFRHLKILREDGTTVVCQTPMTVFHLFTMTGGMDYDIHHPVIAEAILHPDLTTRDVVNAMAEIPLHFEPGTHYRYGLCHDVLAAVVEVVSGMKFSEYLQAYVFSPLGMSHTGFHPSAEQIKHFSVMYRFDNSTGTSTAIPLHNPFCFTPEYESGGGGLFSSVDDYMRFATVLACGGTAPNGYRLLRPESIAQMGVNCLCADALRDFVTNNQFGYGWGLCGRVHINPVYSLSQAPIGEFGWSGAAGAFTMVDPVNRIAICFVMHVLSCTYAHYMIHPLIRNFVYEGLKK